MASVAVLTLEACQESVNMASGNQADAFTLEPIKWYEGLVTLVLHAGTCRDRQRDIAWHRLVAALFGRARTATTCT